MSGVWFSPEQKAKAVRDLGGRAIVGGSGANWPRTMIEAIQRRVWRDRAEHHRRLSAHLTTRPTA